MKNDFLKTAIKLHRAANLLSAACDGAQALDGQGFNAMDTGYGKAMALTPYQNWTESQTFNMYQMLAKYRKQLLSYGFDWSKVEKPTFTRTLVATETLFAIGWSTGDPEFENLLEAAREIPGRSFNTLNKTHEYPLTKANALSLQKVIERFENFTGNAEAHKAIQAAQNGTWKEEQPDNKPAPEATKTKGGRMIRLLDDEDGFSVAFPFDKRLVDVAREIPGRRWRGEDKINYVPFTESAAKALLDLALNESFFITVDAKKKIDQILDLGRDNLEASKAEDSDFQVEGLGLELYPFQRAGVAYLVQNKKTFLADEKGLGKTPQGLATIHHLNAYPAVLVIPATVKYNWEREAHTWLPGVTTCVLSGQAGRGWIDGADLYIINYDILKYHVAKLRSITPKAVIFDESHYIKNYKSQRAKAADDLVNGHLREDTGRKYRKRGQHKVPYVFMLTGTPVLNRPQELLHPLKILSALDHFGGFWKFVDRYIGALNNSFGTDFTGAHNLTELNDFMRRAGLYIRRRKEVVLSELPPKTWAMLPVKISNRSEYNRIEMDTSRWFAERAIEKTEFLAELDGKTELERAEAIRQRHSSAYWKANNAKQLTRIAALKQVAALGKIDAAKKWVTDFLNSGEKLVIFAHHTAVIKEVAKEFNAPIIIGATPAKKRQQIVDAFQTDPEVKVIVGNMKAAGEGITLTAASNVLFLEYPFTPARMDQPADRCHRIGQDDNVTIWQMAGIDTIDEESIRLIANKREVVNAATDGDEITEGDVSVLKGLIEYLEKREKERAKHDRL